MSKEKRLRPLRPGESHKQTRYEKRLIRKQAKKFKSELERMSPSEIRELYL